MLGRYHEGHPPTFRAPAPPVTEDWLSVLPGTWRIDRRIDDHVLGASGTFTGVARWTPAGDPAVRELAYTERGELAFNGHRGPASRSLSYRARPDGTVDVLFADGRHFYHLDPRPGSWQARHDCGRDVYELSARRLRPGRFEERWRVRGPGKDYEIMTTLVRDATDAEDAVSEPEGRALPGLRSAERRRSEERRGKATRQAPRRRANQETQ